MKPPLLSVEDALQLVLDHARLRPIIHHPTHTADRLILRETLPADRDQPPYDRSTMDGIALSSSAWNAGVRSFPLAGIQAAGEPRTALPDPRHAIRIMTGGVLPSGCDVVIEQEALQIHDTTVDVITDLEILPGRYIHAQGSDRRAGEPLLLAPLRLTPPRIAIAVSGGYATLPVAQPHSVTVISTGNEIIPLGQPAASHQIRPSNALALAASARALGCTPVETRHLPDHPGAIRSGLEQAIHQSDLVLISGGVSQGLFDHVPRALADLGVEKVFHKVAQKPGKPLWFGAHPQGATVFGLPGNPVSTLLCFIRYVRPWILASLGAPPEPSEFVIAENEGKSAAPLTTFLPASLTRTPDGRTLARLLPYQGSGDLASLAESHGFVEIPPSQPRILPGNPLRFHPW
ncbi:MAG TPA: molybdopterin molybdotransferase MoeA [Kiritimatiellia bacterium]|nr:molybdopterin molybdotransferase MoeA [Kiritimatiellia bacterium]